jgi:hypothetical protein
MLRKLLAAVVVWAGLLAPGPASAADKIVLNHPDYPVVHSAALDQPELSCTLTRDGNVITDGGQPVIFDAFVDTGASGFVISNLHVTGDGGVGTFGFTSAELLGEHDELGVAGTESGWVTAPFGFRMLNGSPGAGSAANLDEFADYGEHGLWVRQDSGIGELFLFVADPLNIAGTPAICGRAMVMDPTPLANQERMRTHLLGPGEALPPTNVTLPVRLHNFSAGAPNTLSTEANPLLEGVALTHAAGGQTHEATGLELLLDTGAAGSALSLDVAKDLHLVPGDCTSVQDYLDRYHTGATTVVGGIGGTATVPIVCVDELRVAAEEGFDLAWQNVEVMLLDVAGLEGIFGMNLLVPAMTLDYGDLGLEDLSDLSELGDLDYLGDLASILEDLLEELLGGVVLTERPLAATLDLSALDALLNAEISPGYFDTIIFDATDTAAPVLRLQSDTVPEPATAALLAVGGLVVLRRRVRRRG